MSINNSILLATGLTDINFKFTVFEDGSFNYTTKDPRLDFLTVNYEATLDVMPDHCPNCGLTVIHRHGFERCQVNLASTNAHHQMLQLRKMRYRCFDCHSTFMAQSPDLPDNTKISRQVLHQVIDLARYDISAKLIAYILKLSHTKVHKMLNDAANNYQHDFEKELPPVICIDEIKYRKNRYGFEMINGDTSEFIEIFPERTNKKVRGYLSKYDLSKRKNVKLVVTDMNASYQTVIRIMFPNARVVIDRFHTVQLAMKAVQSVRIGYQHILDNRHRVYKLLKSNWKLFITRESKYDLFKSRWFKGVKQYAYITDVLQEVFDECPKLQIACDIYQLILRCLDNRCEDDFVNLLDTYQKNGTPMDGVIRTYRKYRKGIIESFRVQASNGRMEGTNRRIKQMMRTAYGYARTSNFFFRIRLQLMNKDVLTKKFMDLMTKK
jgi:transposase